MKDVYMSAARAVELTRAGTMFIITDDEDREDEGDLFIAAGHVSPGAVSFMANHGKGLVCQTITGQRARELSLPLMTPQNTALHGTAFTVSVDAVRGTTTGISASDRSATIQAIAAADTRPDDLGRPGHVFPIIAHEGGLASRAGHTEASVHLCRKAGLAASGVICEIINPDGTMTRGKQLEEYAGKNGLQIVTIKELLGSTGTMQQAKKTGTTRLPTTFGVFECHSFMDQYGKTQLALVNMPDGTHSQDPIPVRIHSACLTGESLSSARCDCKWQLETALKKFGQTGGVLIYLAQEGRGIGLEAKIRAYALQDIGLDTMEANLKLGYPADGRSYEAAISILETLGIKRVELLTNNPFKVQAFENSGIIVTGRRAITSQPVKENKKYLETKKEKMGHML